MTAVGDGETDFAIFDHVDRQWQRIRNICRRGMRDMNSGG